jgi:hypothetical protein
MGPAGVRALAAAILSKGQGFKVPGYKHVKALRMWKADAKDTGCAAIAEVLRNGPKESILLEMVELMDSNITSVGAAAMGSALMLGANASLTTLRLDMNPAIGDEGIAALARGLRTNRTLKVLTLSYCGLGPSGAASIASVITSPLPVLEAIDLTGNALTSVGLEALATAAKSSKFLKELVLCDNSIGGGFLLPRRAGAPGETGLLGDTPSTPAPSGAGAGSSAAEGESAAAVLNERVTHAAAVSKAALTSLGEALSSPDCGLCRVNLEMNALTTADAETLLPFLSPDNKKVEMFKVSKHIWDARPRFIFAKLPHVSLTHPSIAPSSISPCRTRRSTRHCPQRCSLPLSGYPHLRRERRRRSNRRGGWYLPFASLQRAIRSCCSWYFPLPMAFSSPTLSPPLSDPCARPREIRLGSNQPLPRTDLLALDHPTARWSRRWARCRSCWCRRRGRRRSVDLRAR